MRVQNAKCKVQSAAAKVMSDKCLVINGLKRFAQAGTQVQNAKCRAQSMRNGVAQAKVVPSKLSIFNFQFSILLFALSIHAAQWSAQTFVDTDSIWVGDRYAVRIEVTAPQNARVELPGWADALAPSDVLDWNIEESTAGMETGWRKKVWHAHLRTFEAGAQNLGPLRVEGVIGSDTTRLDIAPTPVVIRERLADSVLEVLDVEPPLADPHWPWWVWTLIGAGVTGLLALLIWKLWRRKTLAAVVRVLPPYEEAMEALQLLRARALLAAGDQAEYFAELSVIIRRYLQRRYTVDVLDATTAELRQRLAHVKGLPQAYRESTIRFASETDLVKFARAALDPAQAEQWDVWAERLLNDTKPAPEPENGAPGTASPKAGGS
jgi:hypothetical protein